MSNMKLHKPVKFSENFFFHILSNPSLSLLLLHKEGRVGVRRLMGFLFSKIVIYNNPFFYKNHKAATQGQKESKK